MLLDAEFNGHGISRDMQLSGLKSSRGGAALLKLKMGFPKTSRACFYFLQVLIDAGLNGPEVSIGVWRAINEGGDHSRRTADVCGMRNNIKLESLLDSWKMLRLYFISNWVLWNNLSQLYVRSRETSCIFIMFFLKLSQAKVNISVIAGQKILECKKLARKVTKERKEAWDSFVAVVQGF